jgi:hypothetical protein
MGKGMKFIFLIILSLLICQLVQLSLLNFKVPVSGYPACAINAFKAKTVFYDGASFRELLSDPEKSYAHPDYPLDFPFLLGWSSFRMEVFDDKILKLTPLIFGILLCVLIFFLIETEIGAVPAVALLCFIAANDTFKACCLHYYSENILACHVIAALYFLKKAFTDKAVSVRGNISAAFVFLAGAAWVKNEGIFFLLICAILIFIWILRDKIRIGWRFFPVALLCLSFILPWRIFCYANKFSNPDFELTTANVLFQKASETLISFFRIIFFSFDYGVIFVVFCIAVAVKIYRRKLPSIYEILLLMLTFFPFFAYPVIMIFSNRELSWHLLAVPRLIYLSSFTALLFASYIFRDSDRVIPQDNGWLDYRV